MQPDMSKVTRILEVEITIDQRVQGEYSSTKIAAAKVLAPFPLDMDQVHQSIAETLALLIRNTDATHGVIERKVEVPAYASRPQVEAMVQDPAKVAAAAGNVSEDNSLDDLPF